MIVLPGYCGACSIAGLMRRVVAPKIVGSNPIRHPMKFVYLEIIEGCCNCIPSAIIHACRIYKKLLN